VRYYSFFYFLITAFGHLMHQIEQFLVVSLIGTIAFKKVAKARIGKFKQNILFLSVKVLYLLNY